MSAFAVTAMSLIRPCAAAGGRSAGFRARLVAADKRLADADLQAAGERPAQSYVMVISVNGIEIHG